MTVSPSRGPCVVAIDASEDIRNLYRELLCDEGYEVATLDCQSVSRDVLRQLGPDVVLLDCFIGCDPSGWELLQEMSPDHARKRVPLVICTTDARMLSDESRAALGDGIRVLRKPFDIQELLSAIATVLRAADDPRAVDQESR